ncbi:hypothetical protein PM082_005117 [Marasmius tenuissimus]|nr:hypothetical protein PM082_005117 [Marasmius tenuissimus]
MVIRGSRSNLWEIDQIISGVGATLTPPDLMMCCPHRVDIAVTWVWEQRAIGPSTTRPCCGLVDFLRYRQNSTPVLLTFNVPTPSLLSLSLSLSPPPQLLRTLNVFTAWFPKNSYTNVYRRKPEATPVKIAPSKAYGVRIKFFHTDVLCPHDTP